MKILVLGNGVHTNKRILPALKKIQEVDSITIADKNVSEDIDVNKKLKIINYNHISSIEDSYGLSIIATPPYNHFESFKKINKKSEKILIEKPISNNLEWIFSSELKKYLENKSVFEALMYFHHPIWEELINIIKSKNIKKITTEFSVPHLPKGSHRYSKEFGGGSLNDQGMYPISLASELIDNTYEIKNIKIFTENDYEVDLSGELEILIDNTIDFNGTWGLGKDYKNFIKLIDTDGKSYEINFFYSKPDGTDTKIIIKEGDSHKEINIGVYDQFKIMYQDIIQNNTSKFNYSNYINLMRRYDIYKNIRDEIKF